MHVQLLRLFVTHLGGMNTAIGDVVGGGEGRG